MGCSQYLIHRALCLPTINKGRATLYINFIGQIIMVTLVAFIGLALYAFYKDCDPVFWSHQYIGLGIACTGLSHMGRS